MKKIICGSQSWNFFLLFRVNVFKLLVFLKMASIVLHPFSYLLKIYLGYQTEVNSFFFPFISSSFSSQQLTHQCIMSLCAEHMQSCWEESLPVLRNSSQMWVSLPVLLVRSSRGPQSPHLQFILCIYCWLIVYNLLALFNSCTQNLPMARIFLLCGVEAPKRPEVSGLSWFLASWALMVPLLNHEQ